MVEEIDALAPEQVNEVKFTDGTTASCNLLCDLLHLEGAEALATYQKDFMQICLQSQEIPLAKVQRIM